MEAQKLLDNAIYYERRKNWKKAILCYDDLLKIFKEDTFKKLCLAAEEEMKILQFQCYFHSASAHQKLTKHDKAIILFEKAIKTLQKTKNDCRVGCITGKNLHWCVPVYARKAFSEIHLDRLKDALKSSESALVLDISNPDIFCIRALVRFLLGDKEKATSDVTQANRMNSSHLCSLLLRIWFEKHNSNSEFELHRKREWSEDEEKAYEINPSVVAYFECTDIKERFMEMFDRYLPTIRCCHTLTVYDILQVSQARREAKDKTTVRKGKAAVSTTGELARSRTKTVIQNEKQIQCSLNTKESDIECNLGTTTSLKTMTKELSNTQVSQKDCHKEKSSKIDIDENRKNPSSLAQIECCKECSSVEEFLKHLISTTKDTSLAKRSKTEDRTEGLALDLEDKEPVRMYPRPWLRNQEFTTLSPNFSTRHLKPA